MSAKSLPLKLLLGLLLLAIVSGAYFYHLSPPERWLLFWGAKAQAYANAMLENGSVPKTMSDDFIDVLVTSDPKGQTVLFSPHDTHEVAVIYAPNRSADVLVYENTSAKRIRENWYALP